MLCRMGARAVVKVATAAVRRGTVSMKVATAPTARAGPCGARWCSAAASEISVQMEHTVNPDCGKFNCEADRDVVFLQPGVVMDVSKANKDKSPLGERLLQIEGVGKVCIADYWLTVTKLGDCEWEELSPLVTEAIKQWDASGEPVATEEYLENEDTEIDESFDTEVVQAIKELVKTRIRTWVQQDGGNIKYIGFEEGVVLLQMQGACQSCPSAGATLKGGIEKMMMHWIPEVLEVRAVDDDFAEEYLAEMAETRRLYRLEDGVLVPRDKPSDADLMNKGL